MQMCGLLKKLVIPYSLGYSQVSTNTFLQKLLPHEELESLAEPKVIDTVIIKGISAHSSDKDNVIYCLVKWDSNINVSYIWD